MQIGACCAALTACAGPSGPDSATPQTASAPAIPQVPSNVPHIRISVPGNSPQTSEAPSAVLDSQGQLSAPAQAFAQQLATQQNLPLADVVQLLSQARYSATAARLIAPPPGQKVLRSWTTYRSHFVEPRRIRWGISFAQDNQAALQQAEQRYGVPGAVMAAIIGVETAYGRNAGNIPVLDSLATLAFDYPDPQRTQRITMFRTQLGDFIALVLRGKLDPQTVGSYAGAIGMPQFMPSSIVDYAVSGQSVNGQPAGEIDLVSNPTDAIFSVGNYLHEHGWVTGIPIFIPAHIPAAAYTLEQDGLSPTTSWSALSEAGVTLAAASCQGGGWQQQPLGLIGLPDEAQGTSQYRIATPNFFAVTQYNHSYFYASAVADLAGAIADGGGVVSPLAMACPGGF